jgi:hypothetical protein
MRMRNLPEPESPPIDTRMLEFVERRREEQARARRQRIQLIAIVALGVISIVLTISNALLVKRLLARPAMPPVVNAPAARSAAPAQPAEPSEAGDSAARAPEPEAPWRPRVSASAPAVPAAPTSRNETPASRHDAPPIARATTPGDTRADERAAREGPGAVDRAPSIAPEPPALPERATGGSRGAGVSERARAGASRDTLASVDTDPALRTARWMIQTHGRLDAETKALAAAQFYSGSEGAFWRRVVRYVRAEP